MEPASATISLVKTAYDTANLVRRILRSHREAEGLDRRLRALGPVVKTIQEDVEHLEECKRQGVLSETLQRDLDNISEVINQTKKSIDKLKKKLATAEIDRDGRRFIRLSSIPGNTRLVLNSDFIRDEISAINFQLQVIIFSYQMLTRHEQREQHNQRTQHVVYHTNQQVYNILVTNASPPDLPSPHLLEPQSSNDSQFPWEQGGSPSSRSLWTRLRGQDLDSITDRIVELDSTRDEGELLAEPEPSESGSPQPQFHFDESFTMNGSSRNSRSLTVAEYDSPLWDAVCSNNAEAVRSLLDEDHDIFIHNIRKETLLHYAADERKDIAMAVILDRYANASKTFLDAKSDSGFTALMLAAKHPDDKASVIIATRLLQLGCDVNCVQSANRSALWFLLEHGPNRHDSRQEFYNLLMDHDANPGQIQESRRLTHLALYRDGRLTSSDRRSSTSTGGSGRRRFSNSSTRPNGGAGSPPTLGVIPQRRSWRSFGRRSVSSQSSE